MTATTASTVPSTPPSTPTQLRPGRLARRVLRRLAIHALCGMSAAVAGGAWCLPPESPRHDDASAATVSAVLLGMVTVLAVVRHMRYRGHGTRQSSTRDGAR